MYHQCDHCKSPSERLTSTLQAGRSEKVINVVKICLYSSSVGIELTQRKPVESRRQATTMACQEIKEYDWLRMSIDLDLT